MLVHRPRLGLQNLDVNRRHLRAVDFQRFHERQISGVPLSRERCDA